MKECKLFFIVVVEHHVLNSNVFVSGPDGVEYKLLSSFCLSLFTTLSWRLDHRMRLDAECLGECVTCLLLEKSTLKL